MRAGEGAGEGGRILCITEKPPRFSNLSENKISTKDKDEQELVC